MDKLRVQSAPEVEQKFSTYPKEIVPKLAYLRQLVRETASEHEQIEELEETLKWGEPSFLTKKGSTIRIDWKAKSPDQYAMYFKCTSKLVSTFRTVFGDTFTYEKNRAILFGLEEDIPVDELKKCIEMALRYHSLKHLPLLGA